MIIRFKFRFLTQNARFKMRRYVDDRKNPEARLVQVSIEVFAFSQIKLFNITTYCTYIVHGVHMVQQNITKSVKNVVE